MKHIKTYKLYEDVLNSEEVSSLFKPMIDWDLISDVKDMSLEYLDNNMILVISIKTCISTPSLVNGYGYKSIYLERFSHQKDSSGWSSITNIFDIKEVVGKNDLVYIFQLTTDNPKSKYYASIIPDETKELVDRIKEYYPNYNIKQRS